MPHANNKDKDQSANCDVHSLNSILLLGLFVPVISCYLPSSVAEQFQSCLDGYLEAFLVTGLI